MLHYDFLGQTNIFGLSLVNYFVEEPLEGSNKINCPVCGGLQDAVKTVRFISTPNLLFVQVMRFVNVDGKMMKKSAKVRCNSKITIHVEGTGDEAATCAYSLSGIVSHIGNYEGGHYTFQGGVRGELAQDTGQGDPHTIVGRAN